MGLPVWSHADSRLPRSKQQVSVILASRHTARPRSEVVYSCPPVLIPVGIGRVSKEPCTPGSRRPLSASRLLLRRHPTYVCHAVGDRSPVKDRQNPSGVDMGGCPPEAGHCPQACAQEKCWQDPVKRQ